LPEPLSTTVPSARTLAFAMKKKVDPRIRTLLEECVANNHRGLIVLVGDKAKDQVVNIHYMLSKLTVAARPSVLWMYKNELGFSSNRRKRISAIKKKVKQGLLDPTRDDPFELFISATDIRFAYYKESQSILGNTYGMCILQDFEALSPNLLARTVETVSGGGVVLLLIKSMSSLRQLYSLTMDVHSRFRTEAHTNVVGRFNERFILSLADNPAALVVDDELNVLPISSLSRTMPTSAAAITARKVAASGGVAAEIIDSPELKDLKNSLADTLPIGPLIAKTRTVDQAKALLRFEEAISEKTLRSTVALTASRGRGKSAALGLAVAAAVAHDYSNIFVTSPSPENLRTFFAFLFVGFDALDFQEHIDYEIIQSTDQAMSGVIVRVNIFRNHRQTVQYISPTDASRSLAQAELLVIDEAAAIPLPVVKSMLGPYLVFLCSTITGYEGTGRSLSLKLIDQLRTNSVSAPVGGRNGHNQQVQQSIGLPSSGAAGRSGMAGRVFREVQMAVPIRYAERDPVETWLYDLLCLEAGGVRQTLTAGAPHPNECELYYVERDALFSRHRASESFLHRVMALFVASHYKNSPNDLQMLSDAPAHALFVLLAPTRADTDKLPDVLCAIQVCLEGRISSRSAKASMSRGHRASGDLIPWTLSQQFQDSDFATLSGARILRVATHPDVQKMGYGTRALKLLVDYYHGNIAARLDVPCVSEKQAQEDTDAAADADGLLTEKIAPRKTIPPLLRRLDERPPDVLDYLGVSYGLTQGLFNFWSRLGFVPLYIRLTSNELTGEHTCIMATTAVASNPDTVTSNSKWLLEFHTDFRRRFVHLLGYEFRSLAPGLALAILEPSSAGDAHAVSRKKSVVQLKDIFTPYDLRRLESYARQLVDYHVVVDMLPVLAELYILGGFGYKSEVSLSPAQSAILMSLGLQHKTVSDLERELSLPSSQILALFNKVIRKLSICLRNMEEAALVADIGPEDHKEVEANALPKEGLEQTLDEDLDDKEQETDDIVDQRTREDSRNEVERSEPDMVKNEIRNQKDKRAKEKGHDVGASGGYEIAGKDGEWDAALARASKAGTPDLVSIRTTKRKAHTGGDSTGASHKKKKTSKRSRN
jgi:N-acetyltransferase 10